MRSGTIRSYLVRSDPVRCGMVQPDAVDGSLLGIGCVLCFQVLFLGRHILYIAKAVWTMESSRAGPNVVDWRMFADARRCVFFLCDVRVWPRVRVDAHVLLFRSCDQSRPPYPPPPLPTPLLPLSEQVGVIAWSFVPGSRLRKGMHRNASGFLGPDVL